uniref:Putative secreted protein n=1 Tax=Ixodes ricinus TaxID=34613 RepID=A0A6B0UPU5_IXORI
MPKVGLACCLGCSIARTGPCPRAHVSVVRERDGSCKRAGGFDLCGLPKLGCSVLWDLLVPLLFTSGGAQPALGGREEACVGERAIERFPRAGGSGQRLLRHLGYSRACGAARHPGGWGVCCGHW